MSTLLDDGLEVIELQTDAAFAERLPHVRNPAFQSQAMLRLALAFIACPDTILQELVNAAIDLCGADSAGISMEREDKTDESFYEWVATAGAYSGFMHATLPRSPSACGVCLERGTPQVFRVSQPFFDLMAIEAAVVTDGILLPWQLGTMRGTIWIMAHGRTEAFDQEDCRMMQVLADFASMGVKHQRQQRMQVERASADAAASMANELAHKINNPLQSLTNLIYLSEAGNSGMDARVMAENISENLHRLVTLVGELLVLPSAALGAGHA